MVSGTSSSNVTILSTPCMNSSATHFYIHKNLNVPCLLQMLITITFEHPLPIVPYTYLIIFVHKEHKACKGFSNKLFF